MVMEHDSRSGAYHYGVMARAIAEVDAAGGAPLPLEALAARMGMSAAHFQRVFTRWAGVSPKRLQQYLTLGHAKALLDERFATLAVADGVGLSGGGRLHDLFVTWEGMSPGEWAGGGDVTVRWGLHDSPFGEGLWCVTDRGICGIAFTAEAGRDAALADMAARWPAAAMVEDPGATRPHAEATFAGGTGADGPRIAAPGAPFQIKVWEALLRIPSGHVTTYSEIAAAIGNPRAVRAVGTAVGRNPVSWLIPCHRALRKSGALGGYHWGVPVKRAMLAREGARADAGAGAGTSAGPDAGAPLRRSA